MSVSILSVYGGCEPLENNRNEMPKMFENGEVSLSLEDGDLEYLVKFDADYKETDDDYIIDVVNYTVLGCSLVTPNGDDEWIYTTIEGIKGIELGKKIAASYSNVNELLRDELLDMFFHND